MLGIVIINEIIIEMNINQSINLLKYTQQTCMTCVGLFLTV